VSSGARQEDHGKCSVGDADETVTDIFKTIKQKKVLFISLSSVFLKNVHLLQRALDHTII